MPVDPWGTGVYTDNYYPNYDPGAGYPGNYPPPSWWDIAQQAIREGAETAQIIGAGYPPGSTVVYSPQYPGGQAQPYPMAPMSPGTPFPQERPVPSGGVQLSNTTLMLLVGGILLFMLGTKKGR